MPAMRRKRGGRRVVAGDHEHVRREFLQLRKGFVEYLKRRHLRLEVAVFACGVRGLVVDEEEVELIPVLPHRLDLIVERSAGRQHRHAHELRQAAVHRVDGHGGSAKLEYPREARELRVAGKAT